MAECTADFELGTNGNTIATGDAGSATAWNSVIIGGSAAAIYDTAHAAHGTQAAKISTGAQSTTANLRWTTALGTQSGTHYGRAYLYLTSNPLSVKLVGMLGLSSASNSYRITLDASGHIQLHDQADTAQATGSVAVALNAWNRLEWQVVQSTTVGQITARLYKTADSTTIDETIQTAANISTLASSDSIRFGIVTAATSVGPFWMDDLDAGASNWVGAAGGGGGGSPPPLGADQIHTSYLTSVGRLSAP